VRADTARSDAAAYCHGMSDRETVRCPDGDMNPTGARFCGRCGKPIATDPSTLDLGPRTSIVDRKICTSGHAMPDADRFCTICGSLGASEPVRPRMLSAIHDLSKIGLAGLAALVVLVVVVLVFAFTRRTSAPAAAAAASPPPRSDLASACSESAIPQVCQAGYSPMPPKASVNYFVRAAPGSRKGRVTVHFHDAAGWETRTVSLPWSHFATLGVRAHAYLRAGSSSANVIPVCEIDEGYNGHNARPFFGKGSDHWHCQVGPIPVFTGG